MTFFRGGIIPVVTFPGIKQLLSILGMQLSSGELWRGEGRKVYFFPGAAWGIAEIARSVLISRGKKRGVVFLPDYFCNQALIPLRRQPMQLIFYPVTEDLKPDWGEMDGLIVEYGDPDIFFLVHYFGFSNDIDGALRFCKETGAEFCEDAAHVFLPFGDIGKYSRYTVYSPCKLLPVPKIGVIVASGKAEVIPAKTGDNIGLLQWMIKRLIQLCLVKCRLPARNAKIIPFEVNTEAEFKEDPVVSVAAMKLLKKLEKQFEYFKARRRKNYHMIENAVSVRTDVCPIFSSGLDEVTPYLFPIRVLGGRSTAEDMYCRLNHSGIPAQTWPDLPPEVKQNPSRYCTAIKVRNSTITIPVHQNLTDGHMATIVKELRCLSGEDPDVK